MTAAGRGGAIYSRRGGILRVENTTLLGNSAGIEGGAIFVATAPPPPPPPPPQPLQRLDLPLSGMHRFLPGRRVLATPATDASSLDTAAGLVGPAVAPAAATAAAAVASRPLAVAFDRVEFLDNIAPLGRDFALGLDTDRGGDLVGSSGRPGPGDGSGFAPPKVNAATASFFGPGSFFGPSSTAAVAGQLSFDGGGGGSGGFGLPPLLALVVLGAVAFTAAGAAIATILLCAPKWRGQGSSGDAGDVGEGEGLLVVSKASEGSSSLDGAGGVSSAGPPRPPPPPGHAPRPSPSLLAVVHREREALRRAAAAAGGSSRSGAAAFVGRGASAGLAPSSALLASLPVVDLAQLEAGTVGDPAASDALSPRCCRGHARIASSFSSNGSSWAPFYGAGARAAHAWSAVASGAHAVVFRAWWTPRTAQDALAGAAAASSAGGEGGARLGGGRFGRFGFSGAAAASRRAARAAPAPLRVALKRLRLGVARGSRHGPDLAAGQAKAEAEAVAAAWRREVSAMAALPPHGRVIGLLALFLDDSAGAVVSGSSGRGGHGGFGLVLEWAPCGSLKDALARSVPLVARATAAAACDRRARRRSKGPESRLDDVWGNGGEGSDGTDDADDDTDDNGDDGDEGGSDDEASSLLLRPSVDGARASERCACRRRVHANTTSSTGAARIPQVLPFRADRTGVGGAAALVLAADVAEALAHCHAHGVLHRDVKASNVLLFASASSEVGATHPARVSVHRHQRRTSYKTGTNVGYDEESKCVTTAEDDEGAALPLGLFRAKLADFGEALVLQAGDAHGGALGNGMTPSQVRCPERQVRRTVGLGSSSSSGRGGFGGAIGSSAGTNTTTAAASTVSGGRGTLLYAAPELVRGQPGSAGSDVWGLGMVTLEVATGRSLADLWREDTAAGTVGTAPDAAVVEGAASARGACASGPSVGAGAARARPLRRPTLLEACGWRPDLAAALRRSKPALLVPSVGDAVEDAAGDAAGDDEHAQLVAFLEASWHAVPGERPAASTARTALLDIARRGRKHHRGAGSRSTSESNASVLLLLSSSLSSSQPSSSPPSPASSSSSPRTSAPAPLLRHSEASFAPGDPGPARCPWTLDQHSSVGVGVGVGVGAGVGFGIGDVAGGSVCNEEEPSSPTSSGRRPITSQPAVLHWFSSDGSDNDGSGSDVDPPYVSVAALRPRDGDGSGASTPAPAPRARPLSSRGGGRAAGGGGGGGGGGGDGGAANSASSGRRGRAVWSGGGPAAPGSPAAAARPAAGEGRPAERAAAVKARFQGAWGVWFPEQAPGLVGVVAAASSTSVSPIISGPFVL